MGNNAIAVNSAMFSSTAMFDVTRTVTTDLEVRERAVTRRASWGEVCPSTGGTDFRAMTSPGSGLSGNVQQGITLSPFAGSARYGSDFGAFSVLNNVQLSKPRTGYDATSGTG